MRFAYPLLLLLVPLIAVGGFLLFRQAQKRARKKLEKFSPASRLDNILRTLNPQARRRKAILCTAGLCLLALAVARPLWGPHAASSQQTGAEFFIVLDVSKSMLVRDVAPNRLEAVKESLTKWLKTRRGDRIGLILMAGDAFVQAPLTNDYTALSEVLAQSSPASISLGGTNIPNAMKVAAKALEAGSVKQKAIVIVSDGENLEGHPTEEIEQLHHAQNIAFFTIGVGTLEGGKVPEKETKPDFTKPPRAYVRDEYGVTAHSRLDERSLRAIALAGGGRYFGFTPDGDVWNTLYMQSLAPVAKRSETFNIQQYDELFQIPLFAALLLLVLEMSLSTRHKNPMRPRSIVTLPEPASSPTAGNLKGLNVRTARAKVGTLVVLLASSLAAGASSPTEELIRQSEAMMKGGKAHEAAAALRAAAQQNPNDFYLIYNTGIASYAAGEFQDAIDAFSEATLSPDKSIRGQALMQLGNAQFQLSKALLKNTNRVGASVALERAVESYESALTTKLTSTVENNLKVSKEKLETLLLELAKNFVATAQKTTAIQGKIAELTKAVAALERVTQLNPKNTEATKSLEETRKMLAEQLRDQARELRAKADQATDPKKEKEQEKLNLAANDSYQQARENSPADKALEKEHEDFKKTAANALTDKAEQTAKQATEPNAKGTPPEAKKRAETLGTAMEKVDKALAFDEKSTRALALKAQLEKDLEKALVDAGDQAKAAGEKQAATQPEAAANNFSEAMKNFQKALEVEPDNGKTKEKLAQTEAELAKALTDSGKKELAQATDPKAQGKGAKPAGEKAAGEKAAGEKAAGEKAGGEPDPSQLRENIGRLEKAAQSFAQAEALRPGENDAKALQDQALDQLGDMRAALDQAQNKPPGKGPASAANGEPQPGEPSGQPSDQPSDKPSQQAGTKSPVKPVLSFSEIRSAEKGEGLFKDLRQKSKIRDW